MSYELNRQYLDFGPLVLVALMGDMNSVVSLTLEMLFPIDGEL